mmetsp:Transcript_10772/g.19152  ORF Transcript_10772/g.19152 Transcript_10772/m.19152 type:complete len:91 (-) Transcript_10772:1530-1802(-)
MFVSSEHNSVVTQELQFDNVNLPKIKKHLAVQQRYCLSWALSLHRRDHGWQLLPLACLRQALPEGAQDYASQKQCYGGCSDHTRNRLARC